jgi:uncharacterized protein involved in exopolysaccharide biosynthesis
MDAEFFENDRYRLHGQTILTSPRYLAASLLRDRFRIAVSAMIMLVIAISAYVIMPPRYDAKATLLVLLSSDYTFRPGAGSEQQINAILDRESFLQSEAEILKSPLLAREVIHEIGLGVLYPRYLEPPSLLARIRSAVNNDVAAFKTAVGLKVIPPAPLSPEGEAIEEFDRALSATPDKEGSTIGVEFRHTNPEVAARAVNDLIKLYLQRRADLYRDVEATIVDTQASDLHVKLDQAAQAYAAFKASAGISDFATQQQILLRQQGDISMDLKKAGISVAQSHSRLAVLDRQLANTPAEVSLYRDSRHLNYGAASAEPEQRIQPSRGAGGPNTPAVVRVGRNELFDKLSYDRSQVTQALQAAEARYAADQKDLVAITTSLDDLDAKEVQLQSLQRNQLLLSDAYDNAVKSLNGRRLLEAVDARKTANVRVIQPADVPLSETPIRKLVLAAGLALTLVVAVAVALVSALLRRGYLTPEAIEHDLGLSVLVSLPTYRTRPRSAFSEGPASF